MSGCVCVNFYLSEFHFLPRSSAVVKLIAPLNKKSSRLCILEYLDPRFLVRIHWASYEVITYFQKYQYGDEE
jgi:hypothetical protein